MKIRANIFFLISNPISNHPEKYKPAEAGCINIVLLSPKTGQGHRRSASFAYPVKWLIGSHLNGSVLSSRFKVQRLQSMDTVYHID